MKSIATFPLAALCGLVMIASLFLSWVKNIPDQMAAIMALSTGQLAPVAEGEEGAAAVPEIPTSFGPADVLDIPGFSIEQLFQTPMGVAVAASFVLAAAVAVLGFLGGMVPRLFAILAGILPFGIVGWAFFQAGDQVPAGVPLPSLEDLGGFGGLMDSYGEVSPFIGPGLYAYFGGAIVLLLLGLFSPSKKDPYDGY